MRFTLSSAGHACTGAIALACLLVSLSAGAETSKPPTGPLAEREITITNRADRPINESYISRSNTDTWGTDRLDESLLAPGASTRIRVERSRDCVFDIQVIYEDATREDRLGYDLCRNRTLMVDGRNATPLPGMLATQHLVTLLNHTHSPIRQVFISPAYAEQWGEDLLNRQLAEGESIQLAYRGDCAADLRVVFANRAAEERRGLDICRTPGLSIIPGWTTAEPVPTTDVAGQHTERAPDAPIHRADAGP